MKNPIFLSRKDAAACVSTEVSGRLALVERSLYIFTNSAATGRSPEAITHYETALRLGEGLVRVADMDDAKAAEILFSSKFSCPVCDYSLPELEPRLFSFNNPMGACQECDGLGHIEFFDPKRIVAFPNLSLASGAVKGWDRRNQFYFQMLTSLAAHYGFNAEAAWEDLPEDIGLLGLPGGVRLAGGFESVECVADSVVVAQVHPCQCAYL